MHVVQRPNLNLTPRNFHHLHSLQLQRIPPVRRPSRKDSAQHVLISARMHLQNIAPPLVQPCHHKNIRIHLDSLQPLDDFGSHLDPHVRRSFIPLSRRTASFLKTRSHHPDRPQTIVNLPRHRHNSSFRLSASQSPPSSSRRLGPRPKTAYTLCPKDRDPS